MEKLMELEELEIGSSVESFGKFLDSQKELFHTQIDQLQKIVVNQCQLTGVNPLSQEMAAGALSINIGKRPRDLLNPKAVKYMQELFAVKDAITKKESRDISALFGITLSQVRNFFNNQRSRVRKIVRLSTEKAVKSSVCIDTHDENPISSDSMTPLQPVPLNSVETINAEEAPSCSTQDENLPASDDVDKHFVESIFTLMRKEETFAGQVKLMEWILQIQDSSVLNWYLSKGGAMILTTWLSQAAIEEQTTVLVVILKVLCHLPLQKALPEHMSAILQSVNQLRFYRTPDISNRAKVLLSRCSKMFARSQALKKFNGTKSFVDTPNEILLKQSIGEITGDESWQSIANIYEGGIVPSLEGLENLRKLESTQPLKLLPSPADDSAARKPMLGISPSHNRERRKVQLVEQPGQKISGRSAQATRAVPVSQSRPMSADDIQKAKLRAQYMQSKHGKTVSSSNGSNELTPQNSKVLANGNRLSTAQVSLSPALTKVHVQPKTEEQKKPQIVPLTVSNKPETFLERRPIIDSKKSLLEACKSAGTRWQTPPEMVLNHVWTVGAGNNSKEVDAQTNRNCREKETIYRTGKEIPLNPREPWDLEMDYDDSLTPEIPIVQQPEAEAMETQITHNVPQPEPVNNTVGSAPSSLQIGSENAPEPDLELLAVLLKNPELVFALTSGQGGNLPNEQMVKLLDMIKTGGPGLMGNLNELNGRVKENVEASLPSPTPSSPATSGWKPEIARNPFTQLRQTEITTTVASPTIERLPTIRFVQPQTQSPNLMQQAERRQQNTVLPFRQHTYLPNSPQSMGPSLSSEPSNSFASTQSIPNSQQQSHAFILRSYRPPMANVGPAHDSFGARQGLVSNHRSQSRASQNNYNNAPYRGTVSNQYRGNNGGFESWSPDNSPTRSMQGRDPPPRMDDSRWNYRPERLRQRDPSGYREDTFEYRGNDNNGQGNRKWNEQRR